MQRVLNLPNILTLSRIFVIPIVIALFYWDSPTTRWVMLGLFTVAGITDFFDGYLARRSNQVSAFGRFLDPIADKLLVAALLLMLVGFERMTTWSYLPAVVILTRELLVSGLREFLAQTQVSVPVSTLAKWKTTLQMFTLGFLIVGSDAPTWIPAQAIGEVGLWLAALLTIITGYDYLKAGLVHMLKDEAE
ncbi:MAG: CDP-diacylglycerol--glycerol-3-phosphate 3-phosphatidyltransferase [Rhodospirillaceae bacterium]|jgi:cardiolipin synthase (CMP-forming)|nr:CDP-diacylglycerol--glycerol-3-phosphate 3-phosphatidyltransferase [Rhodospirillaceae bacterium]MBT5241132.1 CDP-diacylglycerol--glycerol-3-phosphate 3-phosphatidyltransferase [Rhodospirillaceae bacterium]MBT5565644.1 CDP-diacylglycerol--glycerol-3-phosphate 3-phosphatidyltransferase [Rhodospirillaceae bacterium]MBT6090850.1 CDP-diacylglycerol--glycerol-3-phosphate 3-phosphatidyltransferase [Rhodospirillaceae bacterium]MBT6960637.1 CDP-diacylglycerol--glycerol-3-phosphate 3-phosphatidyltrans